MTFTVRQARLYAGLTQNEIASRMGISRDIYRRIELEPETTSVAMAQKFSDIVKIPIDQIFFAKNST